MSNKASRKKKSVIQAFVAQFLKQALAGESAAEKVERAALLNYAICPPLAAVYHHLILGHPIHTAAMVQYPGKNTQLKATSFHSHSMLLHNVHGEWHWNTEISCLLWYSVGNNICTPCLTDYENCGTKHTSKTNKQTNKLAVNGTPHFTDLEAGKWGTEQEEIPSSPWE